MDRHSDRVAMHGVRGDVVRAQADAIGLPLIEIDPCGENGEFHTLCHAGPLFARPLHLVRGETTTRQERFRCMDLSLS